MNDEKTFGENYLNLGAFSKRMVKDILEVILWVFLFFLPIILTILIIVKEKKYTLIGEIIGGVTGVVLSLLIVIDNPTLNRNFLYKLITQPFVRPCLDGCVGQNCLGCLIAVPIVTTYFLLMLGILIGWIFERIKSKKEL